MSPTSPSEDARNFYQQRLALMFLVCFALSVAFLVGNLAAVAAVEGHVLAELRRRAFHVATTVILGAVTWVLRRRRMSHRQLVVVDMGVILLMTLMFAVQSGI
ncbi:MAG TPA: hypothetical protein VLC54_21445, partial [Anaeromyxobacter sp.]|nr:hypothetical protein [Anaeromyxobacter sp.]